MASINFNVVKPRYFSRTASGADISMALIWLITAVRCLTAERRAMCRARNPVVASSLGVARPSPANTVRAALYASSGSDFPLSRRVDLTALVTSTTSIPAAVKARVNPAP